MTVNLTQARECMSTQPSVNARRAWLDACAAFEDARVTCGNPDLLRMAAFLERVATALWASDSRACHLAAIHATQIARLLVAPGTLSPASRIVLASDLEGASLDLGDALDDASRPLADPTVQQIDAITGVLWSSGNDECARAAVRLQRIAVMLVESGLSA
ncbi:hypothetical protein [Burkholderia pseudomallei]|uniref:hypothetical protein n=1 Tax=Burkholderia pseudomallei TaxID=28450 RepID=UPI000F06B635|nr:hypothetical protein [Burkholderia pseudomallei]CAJ4803234.1 Uncharacterised protein [Burkholderia pseudomallei]CAJ5532602.1 Uncharacterised protein [Burkholderia pseudomallei]CAJ8499639.1 Uncharacterised protein [Burkholderia pseudomallei]CAK0601432.1 Uncharacterised protein [Burkholderia pseudomallei]VBC41007.1 Uncharacterised protein [Burkholderia pseudomallei]